MEKTPKKVAKPGLQLVISVLVATSLILAELYVMINQPANVILLVGLAVLVLIAVYFVIDAVVDCGKEKEAALKEKYDNIDGKVYAIKNDFFGHSINVSGLITGQDLIAQLKGKDLGEHLFITQNMLRRDEMDFLDDVTLEDASAALGVPIYPVEQDGDCLCDAFLGILPEVKLPKRESGNEEYYKYN